MFGVFVRDFQWMRAEVSTLISQLPAGFLLELSVKMGIAGCKGTEPSFTPDTETNGSTYTPMYQGVTKFL